MPRRNHDRHARPGRNRSSRARGERIDRAWREVHEDHGPLSSSGQRAGARSRRGGDRPAEQVDRPVVVICPKGKRGWVSKAIAEAKLAEYAAQETNRARRPVRVYLCPHCDTWHLTSAPLFEPKTAPPLAGS